MNINIAYTSDTYSWHPWLFPPTLDRVVRRPISSRGDGLALLDLELEETWTVAVQVMASGRGCVVRTGGRAPGSVFRQCARAPCHTFRYHSIPETPPQTFCTMISRLGYHFVVVVLSGDMTHDPEKPL